MNKCLMCCLLSFPLHPQQTFVNDVRIQEQMYITLKLDDKLRFGYDILLYADVLQLQSSLFSETDRLIIYAFVSPALLNMTHLSSTYGP